MSENVRIACARDEAIRAGRLQSLAFLGARPAHAEILAVACSVRGEKVVWMD